MNSPMYPFILNMWVMGKIDPVKVQSYVPKYITQLERDAILITPQVSPLFAEIPQV
ncbi:hypothetical protein JCM17380_03520 [Desulfosporosinus burensis]